MCPGIWAHSLESARFERGFKGHGVREALGWIDSDGLEEASVNGSGE